jgi:hypothetical protein
MQCLRVIVGLLWVDLRLVKSEKYAALQQKSMQRHPTLHANEGSWILTAECTACCAGQQNVLHAAQHSRARCTLYAVQIQQIALHVVQGNAHIIPKYTAN